MLSFPPHERRVTFSVTSSWDWLRKWGKDVTNLKRGDRAVVPFTIACGKLPLRQKRSFGRHVTIPIQTPILWRRHTGTPALGLFGYSHMMGGYAGGQAQYARVPFANVGPLKIESDLPDEKVLFLSDIFPTGYMAAENAQIQPGDTVAVWGCGPVGQFAIASAFMLGAGRVIAIDRFPERPQSSAITRSNHHRLL